MVFFLKSCPLHVKNFCSHTYSATFAPNRSIRVGLRQLGLASPRPKTFGRAGLRTGFIGTGRVLGHPPQRINLVCEISVTKIRRMIAPGVAPFESKPCGKLGQTEAREEPRGGCTAALHLNKASRQPPVSILCKLSDSHEKILHRTGRLSGPVFRCNSNRRRR